MNHAAIVPKTPSKEKIIATGAGENFVVRIPEHKSLFHLIIHQHKLIHFPLKALEEK